MRVLIIPERFPENEEDPGGIFILDQIKAIMKFASVEVFYTKPLGDKPGVVTNEIFRNVKLHRHCSFTSIPLKIAKALYYFLWLKEAQKAAKDLGKFDIIHMHGATLRGKLGVSLSKFFNCPLILTEHTGPWSSISSRRMVFEMAKKTMTAANVVLPVSNHLKNEITQSGIPLPNCQVIGNPVDTEFFTLPLEKSKIKNILFVSRLDEFKGGLRTLKAFHSVKDQIPDWNLTLAGSGEEERNIKDFVIKNDLSKRVSLLPFQNRSELRNLFHNSAFLVFPSRHESFGLVAAEAMACGLPLICTNKTGPVDFFNSDSGISVNPDDVSEISQAIHEMINGLEYLDSEQIRVFIQEKYSLDAYGKKLMQIYETSVQ